VKKSNHFTKKNTIEQVFSSAFLAISPLCGKTKFDSHVFWRNNVEEIISFE